MDNVTVTLSSLVTLGIGIRDIVDAVERFHQLLHGLTFPDHHDAVVGVAFICAPFCFSSLLCSRLIVTVSVQVATASDTGNIGTRTARLGAEDESPCG
ncbi:hypothetical protein BDV32DRAFT_117549 [Aspergillus pseudonomiae]|nr:hypothetical protein BDV32DRAFT_117549 [Aspergillus pseudonomiae]